MQQRDVLHLDKMIEAAATAIRICDESSVEELESHTDRRGSLFWNFMVLGEAARQVSEEVKSRFPELQWRQPIRLRNRVVHGYWDVDLEILHQTATAALPEFKADIQRIRDLLDADTSSADRAEVIWRPDPSRVAASRISRFRGWLRERGSTDTGSYDELWRWSVDEPAAFWGAVADFFEVAFHDPPEAVLPEPVMPGTRWFPGATLNYAEQALRAGDDTALAVVYRREDGLRQQLTYGQLRRRVAAARAGLAAHGVGRGDRVAAVVPNTPDALVAFLATASLGAVWSSCSPDFGTRAVADRFTQIEPTVLIAVDSYRYNGRVFDVTPTVDALRAELPSVKSTMIIGTSRAMWPESADDHRTVGWAELLQDHDGAPLEFTPVPFEHPLWVLYSSGTTGLPKGIVHGHGGIVLEHLKTMALHFDAGPGERFFWYTTTGWMMWNFLVSGLLTGSTVVLYDGSPSHPDLHALWRMAAEEDVSVFGTSAPFVQACLKDDVTLDPDAFASLRTVGSTGAPLTADGFRWLGAQLGPDVQIASFSGGTDLCTGFLGPAPDVPVWLGELSRPALGAAVAAYDEQGRPVADEVGELVLTRPMPSMPVAFWNDPDGTRLHDAYFADFPGVWRHGDWVTATAHGSAIIHGRSDSTLNRGGVRMGTAEFYRVTEGHPGVDDSLVIDTSGHGNGDGELLCFLVLAESAAPQDVEADLRRALRTELSPRHVPDRFLRVDAVPRTLNGKKCEVPVKKILAGADPDTAVSREALRNPDALDEFVALADRG
ncbi:acetoacetyl-CoA synthetase [Haloactinopolyspora alba]|uniref:Acetoacetyl-CoA synthetase n=1 Tax=Haloactinopolyspora alba TaxID=648780 RepID=A0A2P8E0Y6_9ACTN|nr:acetoacetate--CoA ligase [Haloactinopolyspora alba]PSL03118.1 acetoacetyl-CoA synthetase [Haloactinopolyspora alba]